MYSFNVPRDIGTQWFTSPTGDIQCELDVGRPGVADGAYCQTTAAQQTAVLSDSGRLRVCDRACQPREVPQAAYPLAYGHETELGGFVCAADAGTGITCTSSWQGGFSIARSGITRVPMVSCGTRTVAGTSSAVIAQQLSCENALVVLHAFNFNSVEHLGRYKETTYWTLPAFPGWKCGLVATNGYCSFGAASAGYAPKSR